MRAERTVMEAVTVILVGGLRVGVLLEGKKDRDDKQTLLQAGISRNNKIESLGFTLEHSPRRTPPSLTCPDSLLASDLVLPLNQLKGVDAWRCKFVGSHYSVIHWSALTYEKAEVLDVSGHVAQSEVTQIDLRRFFYALGAGQLEEVRVQREKGFGL